MKGDTMSAKHTAEPWRVEGNKLIEGPTPGFGIGSVYASSFGADTAEMEANARRIVAAVNACAGISTEALETIPPPRTSYSLSLRRRRPCA